MIEKRQRVQGCSLILTYTKHAAGVCFYACRGLVLSVFLVLLGKLKLAVFPFPALHCGLHAFYDVTVDAAVLWVG